MLEMKWVIPTYILSAKDPEKVENIPAVSGKYIVIIDGDSQYSNGYCEYSYPAYVTLMDITIEKIDEEISHDDGITGKGAHDEEWDMVIAWIGPIPEIPKEVR